MNRSKRAFVVVIDAWGCGALPDAHDYGDAPTVNTMGNIDAHVPSLNLPTLEKLGLGRILPLQHIKPVERPVGLYGKLGERSCGKDTTTGHWEMMGLILKKPFPTYPEGFPQALIDRFIVASGCEGILGNKPASGTAILDELGEAHLKTGYPIVYTSADSVFQIACHVDKVPLETLYRWCEAARNLLRGEHEVSRVIARPFEGEPGNFRRIGSARHDYAVSPFEPMAMDMVREAGGAVVAVGKIEDIFCGHGVTHAIHTKGNGHGLEVTRDLVTGRLGLDALEKRVNGAASVETSQSGDAPQFVFVNLVDTDMLYGHRRDVQGYAQALEAIDATLGEVVDAMTEDDLLLITGDHGCDPTAPGSDHTREYVPLLGYSPALKEGLAVGTRESFADVGKTVLAWLSIKHPGALPGKDMLASTAGNA